MTKKESNDFSYQHKRLIIIHNMFNTENPV